MIKFLLILSFASLTWSKTLDYCAPYLCYGSTHIACGHDGGFSPDCNPGAELINIRPYIDLILRKHNEYRNLVAGGNLAGFESAVRMATMVWYPELSELAILNVKQCQMKHDACRNTDAFEWSGQNLAWRSSYPASDPEIVINQAIDSWFGEYKDATMNDIESYPSSGPVIGHFTPMVNDRNLVVGCGLVSVPGNSGQTVYFFGCNYAQTNILGRKAYHSGPTASGCTTGTNPDYPALCSTFEPINPNVVL